MTTKAVLYFLSMYPDTANHFGVSKNLDMRQMFGVGELSGMHPQSQFVWFWGATNIPANVPDFVYHVNGNGIVYGYILD